MKKRILIAGGSGLIGSAVKELAQQEGFEVMLLSRTPGDGKIVWHPDKGTIELQQKETFHVIINLAGSSIAGGRWTSARKEDILRSRLGSCHAIKYYLERGDLSTDVYIGASGVGYYRNHGNDPVDETTPTNFPEDWLVQTVMKWEAGHRELATTQIRCAILRMGIVLSPKGGALKELLSTGKFGVLGIFGKGNQFWPWIHIQDVARIMIEIIRDPDMEDVYLAVSPHPVSNKTIVEVIQHQLSPKRIIMHVPRIALKVMLGELHSVLWDSCKAKPSRLLAKNFTFQFPEIKAAIEDLLPQKGN